MVAAGHLRLVLPSGEFALEAGDSIFFEADVPHSYLAGNEPVRMFLVMTYASPRSG